MMDGAYQGGTHVELFDARAHRAPVGGGDGDESSRGCGGLVHEGRNDGSSRRLIPEGGGGGGGGGRRRCGTATAATAVTEAWIGNGRRGYDGSCRGYAVRVRGGTRGGLTCGPTRARNGAGGRRGLGATQPVLAAQLRVDGGETFSIEVTVVDGDGTRRRLVFSSSFTEVRATPLHCQVPLRDAPRDEWVNVLLPLDELVPACFPGSAGYREIEAIAIRGSCRVRKVFTLRGDVAQNQQSWGDAYAGRAFVIPRECDFPPGVRAAAHTVIPGRDANAIYDDVDLQRRRHQAPGSWGARKVAFGRGVPDRAPEGAPSHREGVDRTSHARHGAPSDVDRIMLNLRVHEARDVDVQSLTSSMSSSPFSYGDSRFDDEYPIVAEETPHVEPSERSYRSTPRTSDDDDDGMHNAFAAFDDDDEYPRCDNERQRLDDDSYPYDDDDEMTAKDEDVREYVESSIAAAIEDADATLLIE